MIVNLFLYFLASLIAFGFVVAWARRGRAVRWTLVLSSIALVVVSWVAGVSMLSLPKPVSKEWFLHQAESAQVVGYHSIADPTHGGLFILLYRREWRQPRYYVYPWDENARKLHKALKEAWERAKRGGYPLVMKKPFGLNIPDQSVFKHPPPPLNLPPKDIFSGPPPKELEI